MERKQIEAVQTEFAIVLTVLLWIYCPGRAAVEGNGEELAGKATFKRLVP